MKPSEELYKAKFNDLLKLNIFLGTLFVFKDTFGFRN